MKKNGRPALFVSIRTKFMFVCSAMVVCVICICLMIFGSFYEILRVNASQSIVTVIERVKMNIELFFNEIDVHASSVFYSAKTERLIAGDADIARANALLEKAHADIQSVMGVDANLSLLSSQMRIVASSYGDWIGKQRVLGTHWIDKINRAAGEKVIISGYTVAGAWLEKNIKVISIARLVLPTDSEYKGILLIDIPIQYIQRLCESVNSDGSGFVTVLDDDNFILYHTNEAQIGTIFRQTPLSHNRDDLYFLATIDKTEMLVSQLKSDYSGYTVLGAVPTESIYQQLRHIQRRVLLTMGALLLFSLAAIWLVTHGVTKPVSRMSRTMQRVESGNFTPYDYPERHDEIGMLEKNFNVMLAKLNEMIDHVYKATIREREAKYKALSASIQPHFLYNTLETIALTAYMNDDLQTVNMLNLLADLFRFSTMPKGNHVPLSHECEHANVYLQICCIRNPELFEVVWDIPEALKRRAVLSMLLQPLVENAVKYGFGNMEQGGVLRISARETEEGLLLTVADNGEGMRPERMEELTSLLCEEGQANSMLALKNINDRIRLNFGPAYGVMIRRNQEGGVTVSVLLPMVQEEMHD